MHPHLEAALSRLDESRAALRAAVEAVPAPLRVRKPAPDRWSVAEVLEHLIITDELYAGSLGTLMKTARPDAGAPARPWKASLLGKFLAHILSKPGKMKAPKKFQPGPSPRSGIVEAFLARESASADMMEQAASLDWRALRVPSPALPSWAPAMNLGDVFNVKVVHLTRHAKQIERVLSKL